MIPHSYSKQCSTGLCGYPPQAPGPQEVRSKALEICLPADRNIFKPDSFPTRQALSLVAVIVTAALAQPAQAAFSPSRSRELQASLLLTFLQLGLCSALKMFVPAQIKQKEREERLKEKITKLKDTKVYSN